MRRSSAVVAVVFAAVLAPAIARAQPESYFVDEDEFKAEGFFFGMLFQGGAFLSTSCCDIGGKRGGGGAGIRVGTVATDRLLWVLQLEGAGVPIEDPADNKTKINQHGSFTLGAMYYPLRTLWVQAGLGFATYRISEPVEETKVVDLERSGFAFSSSVGFEILRKPNAWTFGFARQDFALSFEVRVVGALYPGGQPVVGDEDQKTGAIVQITSGLGVQWY